MTKVKPFTNNPRHISKRDEAQLRADLEKYGDLGGIVHDLESGEIVGGNQRLHTLFGERAGEFNVSDADIELVKEFDAPDAQGTLAHGFIVWHGFRYAYRRVVWDADTMRAANVKANLDGGEWDFAELATWDTDELREWGFDAERLTAWNDSAESLRGMLASDNYDHSGNDAEPQIDKAEELQAKWGVQVGDVWQCGVHYVICGDCREAETWARLLQVAGVPHANGVFTSPPYAEQRKAQYGGVPTHEYVAWWEAVQANVRANLAADGSFFVNIKPHCEDGQRVLYVFDLVLAMVRQWGWRFVDELCWERVTPPGTWTNKFKNYFEPVYHFAIMSNCKFIPENVLQDLKSDPDLCKVYNRNTANKQRPSGFDTIGTMKSSKHEGALPSNVIQASGVNGGTHSAAFPVALPTFFVKAYSDPGDVWLDPFCGSGTTLVAAHNEQRIGLGIERLEKYVAVILERMEAATGITPVKVQ